MVEADRNNNPKRMYVGVDVGGTKVLAALVEESGNVIARQRCSTPREGPSELVVAAIEQSVDEVLDKAGIAPNELTAVGVAIPGVVDPDTGLVIFAPNMCLTGVAIAPHMQNHLGAPAAVGNDGNLGALGEAWLGSARNAKSVVNVCVGTGIGSGIVRDGELWLGAGESAGEIGHIVMQIGGPKCGCGNLGCFEAMASRTAIERDIRLAIDRGGKSVVTEWLNESPGRIRSGMLCRALDANDELVVEIMRQAAVVIGHACLTVRHLIDPEVIVLGGGVMEACGEFMMPIVEDIIGNDQLPSARDCGKVLLSALGDDAVVIGAVALARGLVGRSPFEKQFAINTTCLKIDRAAFGEITVAGKTYGHDIYIRVSGKVKKRDRATAKELYDTSHVVGADELKKVCRGGPAVLFIGAGQSGLVELTDEAGRYLEQRAIRCELSPTPEAVEAYNRSQQRKAALMHVTC